MPSGPAHIHKYYCSLDPDGVGDRAALKYLETCGFKLTRKWEWRVPEREFRYGRHLVSFEECKAVQYLIEEWDFGAFDWTPAQLAYMQPFWDDMEDV